MIIILTYHSISDSGDIYSISPKVFREQMVIFKKNFNVLNLDQLKALNGQTGNYGAITFDDGYEDNLINAFPILKELNLPAAIFISAGLVGKKFCEKRMLSWEQISFLVGQSNIKIGSHGFSHQDLDLIKNEAELEREIKKSAEILEEKLNKKIKYFTYPHGRFNQKTEALAQKVYQTTFSKEGVEFKNNLPDFKIARVIMSKNVSSFKFKLMMIPFFWKLKKIYDQYRSANL